MAKESTLAQNKPQAKRFVWKKDYNGYLYITPFIIGFLLFSLYPLYNTFYLSFTDTTMMSSQSNFVGLKNFQQLLSDRSFHKAIKNTWLIWILNFIPQIGIAMLVSIWFTSTRLKLRAVGVWRAIYFLPNLLMPAAVAALFFSLFSFYGPVNQFMVRSGILPEAVHYLQNPDISRGLVVFIQWWMWFGQTVIIVMAGMTAISASLYESAMVDGANAWQMFWRITAPLLKPILIYIFVTSLVGGMQMFDIPFLLTDGRGAPSGSILTNNMLMYLKFSSSRGHIGAASAVGVLVFLMTTIVALGIFFFLGDRSKD